MGLHVRIVYAPDHCCSVLLSRPVPATSLSAAVPGWSLSPSTASLPEPVRLQLITGEWITVSAVTATACGSSVPAQYWPIDSAPSGGSSVHASVTASAIPVLVHSIQPRPAPSPGATSGSGIGPCGSWGLSDSDSKVTEATHPLPPSQRQQAADYNKQLVRHCQQLVGDAVAYSHQSAVLTMRTLWPLSIIIEAATRRTTVSVTAGTVHELLIPQR